MPRALTWLHLSDLHACRPKSGWDAKRVLESLRTDLQRMNRDHELRPDLIFFTGDAAYGHISNERGEAISDQFREADDFFNAVRESFTPVVPKRNLFLVPGNHDVNRTVITRMDTNWQQSVKSLEEIEQIIQEAGQDWRQLLGRLHDYSHFLETYGYDHLLTGRDRLIYADMREVAGLRVGIAGFNSAWSSRGAGPEEYGKLWMARRFQLETILENMPPHDFAIALIHHPGNWLVVEENASDPFELEHRFPFVLHGHEHRDWVRADASNGHTVLAAGACHEWSQGKNNGYNFVRLDLEAGRGEVWLREYESAGGGWRPRIISKRTNKSGCWSLKHLKPWFGKFIAKAARKVAATKADVVTVPTASDAPAVDYETRYRKAVADKLDYVHLFGIDVPVETKEYSLSVAYVSLNLADEFAEEEAETDADDDSPTDEDGDDASDDSQPFVETTLPAEEFFNKLGGETNRLLIRGVAGCGKTTLLRWAAVQAGKDGKLANGWRSLVPFIIRLRDFPDGELPRPQDYPMRLAKELPDAPSGWMDSVLNDGRALLMFDGADELPPARRGEVLSEIRQLMKTHPKNAFVVTTRPEAVERAEFRELGFLSARVETMSPQDRNTFIDRWHAAMEVRLRNRNEPQDLRPVAARLKERLDETPAIARLTVNPLLCAAICALHLKRSENLPETPVDLCEKLTEMLLDRREKEKPGMARERTEDEQYLQLDYAKRKGLLSRLAHHMVVQGVSAVTEAEADQQIAEGLKNYQLTDLRPDRIRQALIERSGMLQESSEQRIEFLHNTLKEYLAAERFVNSGNFQVMADHCHEESWQPVILFALALPREGSDFATQLVRAVLKRTPLRNPPKGRRHVDKKRAARLRSRQFFFFRCCTTAYQIDDAKVQAAFNKLSSELLPPRNLTDAEALVACGDAIVPYLAVNEDWSAQQRAACVRVLGGIGGPRAIRLLRDYGRDLNSPVVSEFGRLFINAPQLFDAISQSLQSLNLSWKKVSDVSALARLTSLQSLDLSRTQVSDVSALARLTSLQSLDLSGTNVRNVSALANLTNLQSLDLSATNVRNVSVLARLTSLQSLDLSWTMVSNVSALARLTSLRSLDLSHSTQVSDVSALANLTNLQSLHLRGTIVSDLSALASLEKRGLKITRRY